MMPPGKADTPEQVIANKRCVSGALLMNDTRTKRPKKICPPCAGKFGVHLPIEVVVTPSPVMQKAANKCGVFAA
jgi:hypothetical protein